MREFFLITILALMATPFGLYMHRMVDAQVMQSTNYRIESDSVNIGGGFSSSTNYTLESTGGEVATGEASSAGYNLKAGYQQMHSSFISLSTPGTVSLSPSIPGITGGTSNGSTTVTVITDGAAGYALTIAGAQSPAMQKNGDTIADYDPGAVPSFSFTTSATDAHFGYSPSGVDITQIFRDDTASCNTGSGDVELACWTGLSVTPLIIAQGSGSNHPDGATTTIYFRVGVGGSVVQPPGTYTATTTLTALPL